MTAATLAVYERFSLSSPLRLVSGISIEGSVTCDVNCEVSDRFGPTL